MCLNEKQPIICVEGVKKRLKSSSGMTGIRKSNPVSYKYEIATAFSTVEWKSSLRKKKKNSQDSICLIHRTAIHDFHIWLIISQGIFSNPQLSIWQAHTNKHASP